MRIPHGLRSALASQSGSSTVDQYFSDVSLLLYGDGTNGSTAIVDSSSNNHTVTVYGDAQISTTQSKFGGSSLYFDGNRDYLRVADSDDFEIGSGDFTFEAWIYLALYSSNYNGVYNAMIACKDSGSTGRAFAFQLSGTSTSWTTISVTLFASTSPLIYTGTSATTPFSLNTWYHIAAVRSGTTLRLYKDGVDVGGGTNSVAVPNTTTAITIGAEDPFFITQGYPYYFPGYIDDLRITKGVARYTSNFTPPTASFSTLTPVEPYFHNNSLLLHGDGTNGSTTVKDDSINNHTITANGNAQISTAQSKYGGSSIRFTVDSTDHLAIPASTSLQVTAAEDFTVEAWVYLLGNRTYNYFVSKGGGSTREWGFAAGPTNLIFYWSTNGLSSGDQAELRSASLPLNTWIHLAAVKHGSAIKLFKDGVQQGADGAFTSIYGGNGTAWVGRFMDYGAISHSFNGHVDDLRITKGVARYTANFTPPTSAFPDL